jgi:dTDP-L-rhamnose 4-epimerase
MPETVLITGGAGFIGRHVSRLLLERGYVVRVFDALIEQVHAGRPRPNGAWAEAELIVGDIRDRAAIGAALRGVDAVIHLAAEVGTGQSMYAIERYTSVNDVGTAVLFEALTERPVRRVVTASSMSIYGEGLYRTLAGELVHDAIREARTADGGWDPRP